MNEGGSRPVACPTLFYLAHCEAFMSENLLGANAEPARRARLAVLGNSFVAYAERWAAAGSVQVRLGLAGRSGLLRCSSVARSSQAVALGLLGSGRINRNVLASSCTSDSAARMPSLMRVPAC